MDKITKRTINMNNKIVLKTFKMEKDELKHDQHEHDQHEQHKHDQHDQPDE